jgi:hypothetical protein
VTPIRSNRLIDTDVLSAGFARLLSAGHLQRETSINPNLRERRQ